MLTVCCATVSGPYPCQQKVRHIVDGRGYCEGHWRYYQQEYEEKKIRESDARIVDAVLARHKRRSNTVEWDELDTLAVARLALEPSA